MKERAWKYGVSAGIGLSGASCMVNGALTAWVADRAVDPELLANGVLLWFFGSAVAVLTYVDSGYR